jgi:hypothetical protein
MFEIIKLLDKKYQTQTSQILLVKSMIMLKKDQDFILNVCNLDLAQIRNLMEAYNLIDASLDNYLDFYSVAQSCVKLITNDEDFMEEPENKNKLADIQIALHKYRIDHKRLNGLITDFKSRIDNFNKNNEKSLTQNQPDLSKNEILRNLHWPIIAILSLMLLIVFSKKIAGRASK